MKLPGFANQKSLWVRDVISQFPNYIYHGAVELHHVKEEIFTWYIQRTSAEACCRSEGSCIWCQKQRIRDTLMHVKSGMSELNWWLAMLNLQSSRVACRTAKAMQKSSTRSCGPPSRLCGRCASIPECVEEHQMATFKACNAHILIIIFCLITTQ